GIAPFSPMLEENNLLGGGHGLERRIAIEKTLERGHERRATCMLGINRREVVVNHAEFLQPLKQTWVEPARDRQHPPVNFRALVSSAAERFAPGGERQRRPVRVDPSVPFLERDLVNIGLEKTRAPKIIHGLRDRRARADFTEGAKKIELPAKRRPTEGAGRSLNGLGEIASAICRSGETRFVLHADRAGKRFFVTRRKQPGRARNEKHQADETKDDRDRNAGT